jgi:Phage integrase, N-terminal SAM-like domain
MVRTGATFADAAAGWLRFIEEDRARKPSTLLDYRSALKAHLLPVFGALELKSITREQIEAWRAGLTGLSNRSKNNESFPTFLSEPSPNRSDLQLAHHSKGESERMSFDQRREVCVTAATVVHHREDVGINGQRTGRYLARLHLEFGDCRHERIALLFGRPLVVQGVKVCRLP